MCEIILNLEPDLTYEELKVRFESITREYSLAVIESTEEGNKYPEASDNIRFLNDFLLIFPAQLQITKLAKVMNNDLHSIKELMISCAELGAANLMKTLEPKTDDMTQREAFLKFGEAWVLNHRKNDLIRGYRKGPAKNSPIYYSKAELLAVRNAEKASRLGTFDNTKI